MMSQRIAKTENESMTKEKKVYLKMGTTHIGSYVTWRQGQRRFEAQIAYRTDHATILVRNKIHLMTRSDIPLSLLNSTRVTPKVAPLPHAC